VANGVIGYGTDSDEANTAVIDASHVVLKTGGRLILGYGDVGTFDPGAVARDRFRPTRIPGLAAEHYLTRNENRHSFACFAKV
jgi:hypothetical protein